MIDIEARKRELVVLLEQYKAREVSMRDLSDFAWKMIDLFSTEKNLQEFSESERPFWYAIWQIQHLTGENEESSDFSSEFEKALSFLNQGKLPSHLIGERPVDT